ncbi:MAG: DNA repair exonuclease [Candidatus Diapherotrites archaeon]|nr:DNA repair exonuclease [Candidatus Diapherotrites archaeon]
MKIAIISDLHLGFNEKERGDESYKNAEEAFNIAISEGADLIVLGGDIFDEAVPSQECFYKAIKLFSSLNKQNSKIKSAKFISGKRNNQEFFFKNFPIVAIFGTHEFRGSDKVNILDIMQETGLLLKIHGESVLFESNNEKVVVYGMGGVPEKRALEVLKYLNPEPIKDCFNIFVMHQSLKEFLPFGDDMIATISLADLPKGFDVLVNGHLHWHKKDTLGKSLFLLPGSTITTQMKKIEANSRKGLFIVDSETKDAKFLEIRNQRDFFYKEIFLNNATTEETRNIVVKEISDLLKNNFSLKPLVKISLKGSLAKGLSLADLNLARIEDQFKDVAIVSISKDLEVTNFKEKIKNLRDEYAKKQSIKDIAVSILDKNLKESDFGDAFDYMKILDLLIEGNNEKALELLDV